MDPLANIVVRARALFAAIEDAEHRAQYLPTDTPDITEKKKQFFCKLEAMVVDLSKHVEEVRADIPLCIKTDGGRKTRKHKKQWKRK